MRTRRLCIKYPSGGVQDIGSLLKLHSSAKLSLERAVESDFFISSTVRCASIRVSAEQVRKAFAIEGIHPYDWL